LVSKALISFLFCFIRFDSCAMGLL